MGGAVPFLLFAFFAPFRGYSCLGLNLCVFAALREILFASIRGLERSPHIPARSDLGVKLGILQILLGHILSQAHIPVPVIRE